MTHTLQSTRRAFALALCAGSLPLARAQARVRRVGLFLTMDAKQGTPLLNAVREGMRALGYTEQRDYVIDAIWANNQYARIPALAAELASRKPDVVVSIGTPATHAVSVALPRTPIVVVTATDPVAVGLAASMARPGRNVTGLFSNGTLLTSKWLELLNDVVPGLRKVAFLANAAVRYTTSSVLEGEATKRGIALERVSASSVSDLEGIVERSARQGAQGLLLSSDLMITGNASLISSAALRHRLPCIGDLGVARDGGLVGYGADMLALFRDSAKYVDRILHGASASELPIEQASVYRLVLNLATAKRLGLTIPDSLLLRADETIS